MLELIVGILLGYFLAECVRDIRIRIEMREIENLYDEKIAELKERIIPARIEKENGMLYMYNRETNEFLGQATTFIELEKALREKFPNKLFNVPSKEIEKYYE
jgi:hypothetical protein